MGFIFCCEESVRYFCCEGECTDGVFSRERRAQEEERSLFEKSGVMSRTEILSRQEILYENYAKTLNIEALTMVDMVNKDVLPAITAYVKDLSDARYQDQHAHKAVNNGRNASEETDSLLDDGPYFERRYLCCKHCSHKSYRHSYQHGSRSTVYTCENKREDSEFWFSGCGSPFLAEQEIYDAYLPHCRYTRDH